MFSRAIHTIRLAASAAYKEPLAPEVFEPIITSFAASQMRKSGKTLEEEAEVAEVQYVISNLCCLLESHTRTLDAACIGALARIQPTVTRT